MDEPRFYYRAQVILQMRAAGHSLREIAGYFLISHQRVAQILRRGVVPAQLAVPFTEDHHDAGNRSSAAELSAG